MFKAGHMKWSCLALALFSFTACAGTGEVEEAIPFVAYSEGREFRALRHDVNISETAQERLDWFQDTEGMGREFFGAFAIAGDSWTAYSSNHNSLRAAKTEALKRCNEIRSRALEMGGLEKSSTSECAVIAVNVPKGYEPTDKITLGEGASNGYYGYLKRSAPKAFAVGDDHSWAAHYAGQTLEWARDRALKTCLGHGVYAESELPTGEHCILIAEEGAAVAE